MVRVLPQTEPEPVRLYRDNSELLLIKLSGLKHGLYLCVGVFVRQSSHSRVDVFLSRQIPKRLK